MSLDASDNEATPVGGSENSTDIVDSAEVTPEEPKAEILGICAFSNCTEQHTQTCRKCERHYCIMHANRFSPNFCMECFKNLSLIESKFTRTFEDFDIKRDKFVVHSESCTKYYMDGPDWPFLNAWIDSLNDEELRSVWNFHFFVMKTIEAENEVRRIENAQKLRNQPTPRLMSSTTKSVSNTTKVTKQADTADDVRKKLKKQGLPDILIDTMLAAMGLKTGA